LSAFLIYILKTKRESRRFEPQQKQKGMWRKAPHPFLFLF